MKFEGLDWHDIGSFLVVFALLWGLGWVGQVFAHLVYKAQLEEKVKELGKYADVKWYWRLFLGFPPINGKVAVRPAVLQILAILIAVLGLLLLPLIGSQRLESLTSAFAAIYWILVLAIFVSFQKD